MAWLSGWQYRREITITEQSGVSLTDYQVKIVLNSTNFDSWDKVNSDGSDIRFTDSDGTTLLDYWIEEWDYTGQTATIWVKVPYIPASNTATIYMYYGNPSATSESNVDEVWGGSVFAFYDFESGTATDWVGGYNLTGGAGGSFTSEGYDFTSATGVFYYDYVSGDGWDNLSDLTVVIIGKVTDTSQTTVHFYGLTTSGAGHVKTNIYYADRSYGYTNSLLYRLHESDGDTILITKSYTLDTDWHIWVAWQDATNGVFKAYEDNTLVGSTTWDGSYYNPSDEYWSIGGLKFGTNDDVYKQVIKRVIVYDEAIPTIPTFYYPEPTYSIGSEETAGPITLELTDGFQLTELYRVGVSKLATESISVSDVLSKQPSITKTESISVSDIFEKLPTKILTETSTLSDVISRGIAKGITETLSVSDVTTKSLQRLFEELSTLADYISKLTKKEFVETSQLIDSIQTIRKIVQEITETVSLSDVAYKLASKILQETETLTDIIKTRITAKSITETLTLQDIIAKSLSRIIAESIALADYVYKKPILTFTETISTTDYVTAVVPLIKNLWEYLSLTDYLEIKPAVTPPILREMINLDKKMALKFITSTARYLEWRKERLT